MENKLVFVKQLYKFSLRKVTLAVTPILLLILMTSIITGSAITNGSVDERR
ncbi:MAG: hypothetical protein ACXAD7_25985 [Candidatus Kariarchaeaceae archaeon]